MKIIVINGQGGVGKDTFVKFCQDLHLGIGDIYNLSMIDGVKEIARYAGWNEQKDLSDRKFLSDLKDLLDDYNHYPFIHVLCSIHNIISVSEYLNSPLSDMLVFIHAREPKDIEEWREKYGAKALLIKRGDEVNEYGNHADDSVFDIDYDYIIDNNSSLPALKEKAKIFIRDLEDEDWEVCPALFSDISVYLKDEWVARLP